MAIALVTGAAQGIGKAVVRALHRDGLRVVASDRNAAGLRALAAEIGCTTVELDVRDTAAVDRAVRHVEERVGPIDVLVNVAGVLHVGGVLDTSDEDWQAVFDVNATGVFRLCRRVGAGMAERGGGAIVTVASNAAGVPRMSMAAYAASKAAAAHFTRCLGLELAGYGVRCNVVSPGSTDTPMQRGMWTSEADARATVLGRPEIFKNGIPLGRIASPGDVAEAVAFLVSERARHITMHDLYVDGGASL
ncbi:2,3-dihydro-2,3-dihydroxybenzoate dehydrogenase [Paractinoplanes globisporus]|uniref:2,3-dihydro-2,3-dihydroxybenzoate dehydrogenase n=1 Tax=Paractinoplanes globisporus TaxID=113565 RepID=A0ABW6WPP8_9ACTN|nr:2,3-dihydro-2,3-dihydroxybenzoate dehydrogenase [Actinoplanes globisporus]